MALFYQKLGSFPKSLKMFNDAIRTVRSLKNRIFECEYLTSKGNLLLQMLRYREARKSFLKASMSKSPVEEDLEKTGEKVRVSTLVCKGLKVLEKLVDREGLMTILETIESKDQKNEIRSYINQLGLKDAPDSDISKAMSLFDMIGDLLSELESFSSAVKFYLVLFHLCQESNKPHYLQCTVLVSIAQTLLDDRRYDEAKEYFSRELEIRKTLRPRNLWEETRTCLKIAECLCFSATVFQDEIIKHYESLIETFEGDHRCKKKILQEYLVYLDSELLTDKADAVQKELKDINKKFFSGSKTDDTIEDDSSEAEEVPSGQSFDTYPLSDVSSLSSDSSSDDSDEEKMPKTTYTGGDDACNSSNRRKRNLPRLKKIKTNEVGETPLHRACIEGDLKKARKLLESGHPVNPRDHCGWLPIHEAANHDFADIVKLLIDSGASINDPGGDKCGGTTPLHDACSNGNLDVIVVLVSKGADTVAFDNEGNTPLDCLRGWNRRVKDLDQGMQDKFNETAGILETKMKATGFDVEAERKLIKNDVMDVTQDCSSVSYPLKRRKPMVSRRKPVMGIDSEDDIVSDAPSDSPKKVVRKKKKFRSGRSRINDDDDALQKNIDEPGVGRNEYESVIKNLRRERNPDLDNDEQGNSNEGPPSFALINADERLDVDEWLIDDMKARPTKGTNLKMKHHDLYESRNLPVMRHRNQTDKTGNNESQSLKRKDDRITKTSVEDAHQEDDMVDSDMIITTASLPMKLCVAGSTDGATKSVNDHIAAKEQNVQTKNPYPEKKKILMKVKLESRTFLIKIPSEETTVKWLIQETQTRYFQMEKTRPVIYIETVDGAILSPDDLILDVIQGSFEVIGKVQSFLILSLEEEYIENCRIANIESNDDCRRLLKNISSTGVMNLSHTRGIPLNREKIVLETITNCNNSISRIDLSFVSSLPKELLKFLKNLKKLTEIIMQGVGLTKEDLDLLSTLDLNNITLLDLSYNYLDFNDLNTTFCGSSPCSSLTRVIQSMKKLKTLFLISTDLSISCFDDEDDEDSLTKTIAVHPSLRRVYLDNEIIDGLPSSVTSLLRGRIQGQKWRSLTVNNSRI
jgi:NF-kappa-B inhibitor-like protein 2